MYIFTICTSHFGDFRIELIPNIYSEHATKNEI